MYNNYLTQRIIINLLLINLLISVSAFAYVQEPSSLINNPKEIWENDDFPKLRQDWLIFSAKESVDIYKTKKMKIKINSANYLDRFKVIQKQGLYLEIEGVYNATTNGSLELKSTRKIKGWANIKDFILLNHPIRTEDSIIHKALIINRPHRIKGSLTQVDTLQGPDSKAAKTKNTIKLMDFINIYHYYPDESNPDYVLLGAQNFFIPKYDDNDFSINNVILGWVEYNRFLLWNTREGLEPNYKRKHRIYPFENEQSLINYYYNTPDFDSKQPKNLVTNFDKETLEISEWPPDRPRYAILKKNNDKEKSFYIGITGATLNERRVKKAMESLLEMSANRDVVFVIDGTLSMGPYIMLVGDIVLQMMNQFKKERDNRLKSGEFRFGITIYRDYSSKENVFEIIQKLSSETREIKSKLSHVIIDPENCKNNPDSPTCYPEAVFNGIIHTIEEINWMTDSRKMIIHIGDHGNHSQNDPYTEDDISRLIVENDISYHAIQIYVENKTQAYQKAQDLFSNQVGKIISLTAENWTTRVREFDLLQNNNDLIDRLNHIVQQAKASCNDNHHCCEYNAKQSRWTLHCVKTKGDYSSTIVQKINKISEEVTQSRSILRDFIIGNTTSSSNNYDKKNLSYKPLLMPGMIAKLINKIGLDILNNKNFEELPEYNLIQKPLSLINSNDLDIKNKARNDVIKILGYYHLKNYFKEDIQYYTPAYVMLKIPGKKYVNDPDQLIKKVLFEKREFGEVLAPLNYFAMNGCNITPKNVKEIWRVFLTGIIGDKNKTIIINENESINTAYKRQHGVSLRLEHPLLKYSYSNVSSGLAKLSDDKIKEIEKYLCDTRTRLKKIYDKDDNFFKILGNKYIWVNASDLP